MAVRLKYTDFVPHLNSKFTIHADSEQIDSILINVDLKNAQGDDNNEMSFSIIFQTPKDTSLLQRVYTVEHENMGELDIFLVPIGANVDGLQYEAVFN